jgi:HlyD family secretion protein
MAISERLPHAARGRLGWIAALAAILIIVAIIVIRRGGPVDSEPQAAALTVTTATVQPVDIARGIQANGSIHPWQEIIVGPEVGGYRVAAVLVDVGDRVKKGQELVRLRDDLLTAELPSKRASLQQAEAALENAAAAYRRAKTLSASGVLSQADLDQLSSEEVAARARVQVAKAELETAELRLKYTRVTAPDDGVISARNVAVGQVAQTGSEMLRMVRQGRVEWRAEIPEARLRDIQVGQAVRITTADGSQIDGKVRAVSPTIDTSTRAGLVYVDIDSTHARAGMFARGEILLDRGTASMLPLTSLVIQDGYNYVFVLKTDNTVERRHVETGVVQDKLIEIVSGLQSGERVVVKGAGFLKDRDHVNVVQDAE